MPQFEAQNQLKMRFDEFMEVIPEIGFIFNGSEQENITDAPKLISLVSYIEDNLTSLTPVQIREFNNRIVKFVAAIRNILEKSGELIPVKTLKIIQDFLKKH